MSWYLKNGKDSDVILYSKSRLTRNLSKVKFNTANDSKDQKKVYEILKKITPKLGYSLKFIDYNTIDELTKKSLLEKNIITKEFYNFKSNYKALIINDEENIAIQVNGQDQIVLQVFQSGKSIEETTKLIIELDKKLEKLVNYAFDERYGYLSPNLMNIGTGLKETVKLHLPGLNITNNIRKVRNTVNNLGITMNEEEGDIFEISTTQIIGTTEENIKESIKPIIDNIIENERKLRKYLIKNTEDIEEFVYLNENISQSFFKLTDLKKEDLEDILDILKLIKDKSKKEDLDIYGEEVERGINEINWLIEEKNLYQNIFQEFDNKNITSLNNEKLAEYRLKNIGIVFQDYQLLDIFTAYENIIFPARVLKKEDIKTIRNKANYFIKMANLENEKDKNITELSGGEKQRVAFARAFMNTPKVILADEPTGALDSKNAANLIKFIRESIKKLGQTMIMVSHDSYVAAYADKVYFLKDGNIISNLSFDRTNIDIDLSNRVDLVQRELLKINI